MNVGSVDNNIHAETHSVSETEDQGNSATYIIQEDDLVKPLETMRTSKRSEIWKLVVKVLKGKKVPKTILDIAYAQYLYPRKFEDWKRNSTLGADCKVQGLDTDINWYSYPERNIAMGDLLCK